MSQYYHKVNNDNGGGGGACAHPSGSAAGSAGVQVRSDVDHGPTSRDNRAWYDRILILHLHDAVHM
ncbi:hypothetical protein CVT25_003887 [Psilocybe cyanescens]|uniref:Uncharacterized protein n=1 Tax=Psilocybe cyanescens TaxID=93625 RepID=A0A409XPS2_PSICY|nr:hypothetical protein CVT25_003887 [Psilocybe cyanescens]